MDKKRVHISIGNIKDSFKRIINTWNDDQKGIIREPENHITYESVDAIELKKAEPVYSVEELIEGCTKESFQLNDEDRKWLYDAPVGKERIE